MVDSWLLSPSAPLFGERVRWRGRARGVGGRWKKAQGKAGSPQAGDGRNNDSGGEAGGPARDGRGKKILFPYVFIRCAIATTALL